MKVSKKRLTDHLHVFYLCLDESSDLNIKHCQLCQAQLELIKSTPSGGLPTFAKVVERQFVAPEGTNITTTITPEDSSSQPDKPGLVGSVYFYKSPLWTGDIKGSKRPHSHIPKRRTAQYRCSLHPAQDKVISEHGAIRALYSCCTSTILHPEPRAFSTQLTACVKPNPVYICTIQTFIHYILLWTRAHTNAHCH